MDTKMLLAILGLGAVGLLVAASMGGEEPAGEGEGTDTDTDTGTQTASLATDDNPYEDEDPPTGGGAQTGTIDLDPTGPDDETPDPESPGMFLDPS